jgi:hypothetical protein
MDTSRKLFEFTSDPVELLGAAYTITGSMVDQGSRIDGRNCNKINLILDLTISDSADVRLQLLPSLDNRKIDILSCLALASCVDMDFFIVTAVDGTRYGVYLDATGSSAAPTSPLYAACDQESSADISGATTAADVATIVVSAFNALTGFTGDFTLVDNADGTIDFIQDKAGIVKYPEDYAYDSEIDGTSAFTWIRTSVTEPLYEGVDAETPIIAETLDTGKIEASQRYYEITTDADGIYYMGFNIPVGLYWQVQLGAGTAGTTGTVNSLKYIKSFV